jgi:hypothetical protein
LLDWRAFGERGRRLERADADRRFPRQNELRDHSRRRGERQYKLAKHEMHPPNAPIVDALLECKMNGRGV